ncbi:hypothetical protein HOD38_00445 [archaeon]|jgi:Arc/MetJ-type ribon-helix-helix transcriptional regulator|nr:hypothetical protein [archaeon]MBT4396716.1 hypothetical protein [archaeon]MBT4441326.1 hypothetical protein [archaeon]
MKHKISVSIEEETLFRLREELRNRKYRNRSHAIEYALSKLIEDGQRN